MACSRVVTFQLFNFPTLQLWRGVSNGMLRFLTAGESHGKALTAVVEGLPAGLGVSEDAINAQMIRRQLGYGRSVRMKLEADHVEIVSGAIGGRSLRGPVALRIENRDATADEPPLTRPRPGHADPVGTLKIGFDDSLRGLGPGNSPRPQN